MIKLEIISKDEYNNYTLKNNNKKYNLSINFYGDNIPNIGDFIYLPEQILKNINIYNFGPVNKKNMNNILTEEEIMKVISKDKEYYLQRYYG